MLEAHPTGPRRSDTQKGALHLCPFFFFFFWSLLIQHHSLMSWDHALKRPPSRSVEKGLLTDSFHAGDKCCPSAISRAPRQLLGPV